MKTFFLVMIFLLSAYPAMATNVAVSTVASSGARPTLHPDLDVAFIGQNPEPVKAGGTVEVWLRMQNNGGEDANEAEIELDPQFPFSLLEGNKTQQFAVIALYPKETISRLVKYTLKVDPNAAEGTYELKVRSTYKEAKEIDFWQTFKFNIDVSTVESVQVAMNQTTLIPGQETPVRFTISNEGNAPLQDLTFSWEDSTGMILPVQSDNTCFIKSLGPGQKSEQDFALVANPTTASGLYKIALNLGYSVNGANSSAKQIISTSVGVLVGGGTDFDMAFSESDTGKTALSVANVGANTATAVTVMIPQQKDFDVRGTNSVIIGNLNKGDYTVASFQVVPKAAPKTGETKMLTGYLIYTDTFGNRHQVEKNVPIQTGPQFGLTAEQRLAQRNKSGNIFSLTNVAIVGILMVGVVAFYRYKKGKKGARDASR